MNEIIDCDNNCFDHNKHPILAICLKCNNKPLCIKCITSKEHRSHELIDLDDPKAKEIVINYQKEIIPLIKVHLGLVEEILKVSEKEYEKIEKNHQSNLKIIIRKFKDIDNIYSDFEKNLKGELYDNIKSNLEKKNDLELKIKNQNDCLLNYPNNSPDDIVQSIKYSYDIKKKLSKISENSNIKNSYRKTHFGYNEYHFESLKNHLKDCIKISKE